MRAEQVTGPDAEHGEGPVWDTGTGRIRWVDMLRGDLLGLEDDGRVTRHHLDTVAAAFRPRDGGGLVVAVERGFRLVEPDGSRGELHQAFDVPGVRMNEGGCDRQGRFYCGSMDYDAAPGRGALYRFGPDRSVEKMFDGVTISNGIAWTEDGATVYYIDSPTQSVDAFDYDPASGTFHDRRTVVRVPEEDGLPDGMALDTEGGLWVAVWDAGQVRRYTTDGELTAVVDVPVRKVTACAFAGPDLGDLYVTTSQIERGDHELATAGALFRADVGVRGLPVAGFSG